MRERSLAAALFGYFLQLLGESNSGYGADSPDISCMLTHPSLAVSLPHSHNKKDREISLPVSGLNPIRLKPQLSVIVT